MVNFLIYIFQGGTDVENIGIISKVMYYKSIIALLRSLIHIRNSRGPNIEPWDTQNAILESSDCLLLTVVNYCL